MQPVRSEKAANELPCRRAFKRRNRLGRNGTFLQGFAGFFALTILRAGPAGGLPAAAPMLKAPLFEGAADAEDPKASTGAGANGEAPNAAPDRLPAAAPKLKVPLLFAAVGAEDPKVPTGAEPNGEAPTELLPATVWFAEPNWNGAGATAGAAETKDVIGLPSMLSEGEFIVIGEALRRALESGETNDPVLGAPPTPLKLF